MAKRSTKKAQVEVEEPAEVAVQAVAPRFSRFAGLIDPQRIEKTTVVLIGCGGIGSWVAMGLACLGVELVVFDPDSTQHHNYGGQPLPQAGKAKVTQVKKMMGEIGRITAVEDFFDANALGNRRTASMWVSGVDSIEARLDVWTQLLNNYDRFRAPQFYIDGRIGAMTSHVILVDVKDPAARRRYEQTLTPKGGFVDDPCTMRSTVFAGMGCAALIVAKVAGVIRDPAKVKSEQVNSEWLTAQNFVGWTK